MLVQCLFLEDERGVGGEREREEERDRETRKWRVERKGGKRLTMIINYIKEMKPCAIASDGSLLLRSFSKEVEKITYHSFSW